MPTSTETYQLFNGICAIPESDFDPANMHRIVSVSRAVCRDVCSNAYTDDCSGFLYNPTDRSCTLSPYTGEWLPATAPTCNQSNTLEFYRRSRSLGKDTDVYTDTVREFLARHMYSLEDVIVGVGHFTAAIWQLPICPTAKSCWRPAGWADVPGSGLNLRRLSHFRWRGDEFYHNTRYTLRRWNIIYGTHLNLWN